MGAGLAGCSVARYLAASGQRVLVLDRGGVGAGASGRNGGFLLRRADPWIEGLRRAAIAIYAELEDEGPLGCGLRARQLLLVAAHGEELADAEAHARQVDGAAVDARTEPWLADDLAGAFAIDGSYEVEPMAATAAMADAAARAGAQFELGVEATRLSIAHGAVDGVVTDRGIRSGSRVIAAAGPATARLLATAGVHLPLAGARGWLMELAPLDRPLGWVIEQALWPSQEAMAAIAAAPSLGEVAAAPIGPPELVSLLMGQRPSGGIVVGTSINRSLREEPEGEKTLQAVAANAARIVPPLSAARAVGAWSGRRAMTPDGRPVVGDVPGIGGLAVASGFSSVGMVTAPETCRRLAVGAADPELSPARLLE